jgi:ferredoxin
MIQVQVDAARCDGFGYCEQQAPEVFQLDDEGTVVALLSDIPEELAGKVEGATRACPVAALRLVR